MNPKDSCVALDVFRTLGVRGILCYYDFYMFPFVPDSRAEGDELIHGIINRTPVFHFHFRGFVRVVWLCPSSAGFGLWLDFTIREVSNRALMLLWPFFSLSVFVLHSEPSCKLRVDRLSRNRLLFLLDGDDRRWEWSPEARMMLGRLALWKGALLVSRTQVFVTGKGGLC